MRAAPASCEDLGRQWREKPDGAGIQVTLKAFGGRAKTLAGDVFLAQAAATLWSAASAPMLFRDALRRDTQECRSPKHRIPRLPRSEPAWLDTRSSLCTTRTPEMPYPPP